MPKCKSYVARKPWANLSAPFNVVSLTIVGAAVFCGCANNQKLQSSSTDFSYDPWARVNHFHSSSNAARADDARNAFNSPLGVLSGAVDLNIQTQQQLAGTAAAADEKLHAQLLADATTSDTWQDLRKAILTEMGVPFFDENGKEMSHPVLPLTAQQVVIRDKETAARITLRQEKIAAVASVLALIGSAQAAVVKQGADNLQVVQLSQDAASLAKALTLLNSNPKDSGALISVVRLTNQVNVDMNNLKLNSSNSAAAVTPPVATAADGINSTIANGQAAVNKANAQVANTASDSSLKAQFLECLLNDVMLAGKDFVNVNSQIVQANSQQAKLLAAIQNSKDPASAFALVAIVGTGLDDTSFDLLDSYVDSLNKQLAWLKPAPPNNSAAPSLAPATLVNGGLRPSTVPLTANGANSWKRTINLAASTADALATAKTIITVEGQVKKDVAGGNALANKTQSVETIWRLAHATSSSNLEPSSSSFSTLDLGPSTSLTTRILRINAVHNAPHRPALSPNASDAYALSSTSERAKNDLTTQIQNFESVMYGARGAGRAARGTAVPQFLSTPGSVTSSKYEMYSPSVVGSSTMDLASANESSSTTSPPPTPPCGTVDLKSVLNSLLTGVPQADQANVTAGFSLLESIVAAQPTLLGSLEKDAQNSVGQGLTKSGLSTADLKAIGSLVNDVTATQHAAAQRLQGYVNDLTQIGADLNQENLRHSQALLTVANIELKRWYALGELNTDYQQVFGAGTAIDLQETLGSSYPLFDNSQPPTTNASKWYIVPNVGPNSSNALAHPSVSPDDNIYISLLGLSQTAKAWHAVLTSSVPDFGKQLDISDQRLFLAVRTVQGHLLMESVNRSASDDNTNRLVGELGMHDSQLDDLHARVEEADFRLTLGSVQAFHDSGITDADIQNALQAVTDVYMGITTARVNK